MEGDDAEPATDRKPCGNVINRPLQYLQLTVYLYANCLKGALCRMGTILSCALRHCLFDNIYQLARCFNGLCFSFLYDKLRDSSRPTLLAIGENHSVQLVLVIAVHHVIRTEGPVRIHPHIQRGILLIGKAALRFIQLMRGNTDIQQHPVNLFNS